MKAKAQIIIAAVVCVAAMAANAQDWTRNFRIGMQLGLNITADFNTSGSMSLSSKNPGPTGPAGATANHEYDDGYIRVDDTGNAQGRTANWGYRNASQFDSESGTLSFHNANSISGATAGARSVDDNPYIGFEAAYGGTIMQLGRHSRLGWEAGFSYMPVGIKDRRPLSGDITVGVQTVTPGITIPDPGYQGTATSAGTPTIPSDPNAGTPITAPGTVTGTRQLDLTLYTLRLGPTFYWHFARRWGLSASAGPAVSIANGDYRYNEFVDVPGVFSGPVDGKFGKTDFLYGGYVNAIALFRLEPGGDLFAGVQFMPLTSTTFSHNGRSAKLDASGAIYFTAGVNWPF